MNKYYVDYYKQQAGTGLAGFQGVRYQKGNGFFGRLLTGAVYPLLRYLGKQALTTGVNIAGDVLENKMNWKDSAKSRLKETGEYIAKDALSKARSRLQGGSGKRRRRRKKKVNNLAIRKKKVIKRRKGKRKTKQRKRKTVRRKIKRHVKKKSLDWL